MSSAPADGPVMAAPHVASLARSFALVPAAAVPAVIDCVLASTALSPSELFFSLLKAFPEPTEDIRKVDSAKLLSAQSSYLISYTAALFHLVKNPDVSPDALTSFIWNGFVPLLGATNPDARELLNQLEDLLCDAVIATQSWELTESTLVPLCLRSVGVSCGMSQHKELAVNQWRCFESREVSVLPLTVACNLLSSLLDAAFRARDPSAKTTSQDVDLVIGIQTSDMFVLKLTWDLSLTAVDILLQSLEHRSCAIGLLFPIIFRVLAVRPTFEVLVNGVTRTFSRPCFFKKIWERCIIMFSRGRPERVDACCLLSLYFSVFNAGNMNNTDEGFDIRAETKLCEEIRRGLVDKDAPVRKHSLYILKKLLSDSIWMGSDDCPSLEPAITGLATGTHQDNALSHSGMTKREKWADKEARSMHVGEICTPSVNGLDRWKAFFLLYDMLEEYGTHLVEAAWTHQISFFFQSGLCDNTTNKVSVGFYQNQMESLDEIFCWLTILWERGLIHENPQVRCLIMQSFLSVDWNTHKHYAKHVPRSFITGPLILGLNDVTHHKDFGVGGVYTSKTIQGAMKFVCQYSTELSTRGKKLQLETEI